jgi:hypothetical protein
MMAMTTTSTTRQYPAAARRIFASVFQSNVPVYDKAEDAEKAAELMVAQTMRTRARMMIGLLKEDKLITIIVYPVLH